jgi:hypothetical protein
MCKKKCPWIRKYKELTKWFFSNAALCSLKNGVLWRNHAFNIIIVRFLGRRREDRRFWTELWWTVWFAWIFRVCMGIGSPPYTNWNLTSLKAFRIAWSFMSRFSPLAFEDPSSPESLFSGARDFSRHSIFHGLHVALFCPGSATSQCITTW